MKTKPAVKYVWECYSCHGTKRVGTFIKVCANNECQSHYVKLPNNKPAAKTRIHTKECYAHKGRSCYCEQPAAHTPTPWKVSIAGTRLTIGTENRFILDFDGSTANQEDKMTDAAFIVKAVNAYEYIMAQVQAIYETANTTKDWAEVKGLCEAIARAEGGK